MCGNGIRNKNFSLVFTSIVLSPREKYEKIEHSEVKCFLHISREVEIYAIPKTQKMGIVNVLSTEKLWENTNIPNVWVSYTFCTPPFWVKQKPCNFEKMRKLNSQSKGHKWENTNIPKQTIGFLHISCDTLIHTIPKIWEKWIPIVRKKYGNTRTLKT